MDHSWLDTYLLSMPGATKDFKVEWEWMRYQVGGKLFAATMCPTEKYAPEYACKNLLNLKCEPGLAELYRSQHPEVLPGFYSDKRNWNAINLDGALDEALLRQMCADSYRLVFQKLTKKLQAEILQNADADGENAK